MALPLPIDPEFRKTCVGFWLDDVDDRLEAGLFEDAKISWKEANSLYLSLPPGFGDSHLEYRIFQSGVKLSKLTDS